MQHVQPVPSNAINISKARTANTQQQNNNNNSNNAATTPQQQQQQQQQQNLHPSLQPVVMQPIAYVESCFREKNGCPRQPLLATLAKARIEISSKVFNNPYGTLEGIEGFSHLWIMFLFHLNDNIAANYVNQQQDSDAAEEPAEQQQQQQQQQQDNKSEANVDQAAAATIATSNEQSTAVDLQSNANNINNNQQQPLFDKTSVRPPRLDGNRLGVFACRAPYRPNPIGITVAKLERIEKKQGNMILHLSGIDLVDTTPIIDIKPYIPSYDSIPNATVAPWFQSMPIEQFPIKTIKWNADALAFLKNMVTMKKLKFYDNFDEIKAAIEQVISMDPRSKHRRDKRKDRIFGVCIDVVNILMKFVYETPAEQNAASSSSDSDQQPQAKRSKKQQQQKKPEPKLSYVEIVEVEDWTDGKPSDKALKEREAQETAKYFSEEYVKTRQLV